METYEIRHFFIKAEEALPLYLAVEALALSLGDVKVEVKKTTISFGTIRKFAWVWRPQSPGRNRPKATIMLTFGLGYEVKSPRIFQAVEPYPNRWTHHVVISDASDLNEEIRGYLREAYEFSLRPK